MSPSVGRRTAIGAALVAAVTGLLTLTHFVGDARPVLWTSGILALAVAAEVSLMGRLAARNLPVILVFPLLAVVFIEHAALGARSLHPSGELAGPYWEQLALQYVWALGLAALVHVLSRGLTSSVGRHSNLRKVFLLVLAVALISGVAVLRENGATPLMISAGLLGVAAVGAATVAFDGDRRADLAVSVALAVWLTVPLPALTQVASRFGLAGLAALLALSKVGDVAGYYVGRAIGKSHPFPRISPGKTTAGCVASLVAGAALGLALGLAGVLPDGPLGAAGGLVAGVSINVASQSGDLLESWVKRRVGVKDSSGWLGASGGLLDAVDSLLVSVPTALVTWPLVFGP